MIKTLTLAVALLGATSLGAAGLASAQTLSPVQAASIDLGPTHGSAYYVAKPDGYHLVATLYSDGATAPVRFNTVLANGQSATVSVPGPAGSSGQEVTFARSAGSLVVHQAPESQTATQ